MNIITIPQKVSEYDFITYTQKKLAKEAPEFHCKITTEMKKVNALNFHKQQAINELKRLGIETRLVVPSMTDEYIKSVSETVKQGKKEGLTVLQWSEVYKAIGNLKFDLKYDVNAAIELIKNHSSDMAEIVKTAFHK